MQQYYFCNKNTGNLRFSNPLNSKNETQITYLKTNRTYRVPIGPARRLDSTPWHHFLPFFETNHGMQCTSGLSRMVSKTETNRRPPPRCRRPTHLRGCPHIRKIMDWLIDYLTWIMLIFTCYRFVVKKTLLGPSTVVFITTSCRPMDT